MMSWFDESYSKLQGRLFHIYQAHCANPRQNIVAGDEDEIVKSRRCWLLQLDKMSF